MSPPTASSIPGPGPGAGLAPPEPGPEAAVAWVAAHLGDVIRDAPAASPRFRGGQRAAEAALDAFDVDGYSARRSVAWPPNARGASGLSPWIRHGLLDLPTVWHAVEGGPPRDVKKFRSELLWQEYARHLYARLGTATARSMRFVVSEHGPSRMGAAASADMACLDAFRAELHRDGWIPNAARMWLASHWGVRGQGGWRDGEDRFFQHLLDGSRAANRLGWQWTVGAQTGRVYTFGRGQVERQAGALCDACTLAKACPIERPPDVPEPPPTGHPASALGRVDASRTGAGPREVVERGVPEAVWLTAESLGTRDPALRSHPDLPVVFVFDRPRLARWRLSGKRLVFLVETLAELAMTRDLALFVGSPAKVLAGSALAATHAPVPGWRALARRLDLAVEHPWPWLVEPHAGPIGSFSAWRKGITPPPSRGAQRELAL